jgi:Polysulphide reductase, NrfD
MEIGGSCRKHFGSEHFVCLFGGEQAMSIPNLPKLTESLRSREPDAASESRLTQLREDARLRGVVEGEGVRPAGAPFPQASPQTGYYGIHLLKEPQWSWEVPVYFFVGGAAGASAIIPQAAQATNAKAELVRDARTLAAIGAILSPALLISDLGRPSRFLYMLRVFKVKSAMSMGVYIVTGFSNAALAAKVAHAAGARFPNWPVRIVENLAGLTAALLGLGMASYTGVLVGATSIPVWSQNVTTLPIHFAMSGLNSAVSALELMGHTDSRALNVLGITACALETAEGAKIELKREPVNDPLKKGTSGLIVRLGGMLSGPMPLALRVLAAFSGKERARNLRRYAAIASLTGSYLTRLGWVRAGHASARDYRIPLQIAPGQNKREEPLEPGFSITHAAD